MHAFPGNKVFSYCLNLLTFIKQNSKIPENESQKTWKNTTAMKENEDDKIRYLKK